MRTFTSQYNQPNALTGVMGRGCALAHEIDPLGRTVADGRFRYTYTPAGQIETVTTTATTAQSQVVATYAYNSQQQRVRKTLADGSTTYYLWQQGKLVAEINSSSANIDTQYLYFSEGQHTTPIAKLEQSSAAHTTSATLFIHSDHRATPVAMTDHHQRIVWQANLTPWGLVKTTDGDAQKAPQQATLNIRLPGQYFDAETGLHDNWHRTYNPRTGRYLQPDPLGYHDGPDPYLYAGGDPLNSIDPTGLYQEDMHYYMVFFLALAAGMEYEQAHITALASQYVDDNAMTRPLDEESLATKGLSAFKKHLQLVSYHFVLSDSSDAKASSFGHTLASYNNNDVLSIRGNPSPQLANLLSASNIGNPNQPCAKYQFLGEFLHAYADTFSHRDGTNLPIDAVTLGVGLGHGASLSEPDYTYNGDPEYTENDPLVIARLWNVREARTLAADKGMFSILARNAPSLLSGVAFSSIEETLTEFNETKEDGAKMGTESSAKRKILQTTLNELIANKKISLKDKDGTEITKIDFTDVEKQGYNKGKAEINRETFLQDLKEADYPGTCLPGGTRCKPV